MSRFDFTKEEYDKLISAGLFSEDEEKILLYNCRGLSIVEMSQKLSCSTSKIDKDIKKIKKKLRRLL
jgi:DNA-directed RNA polymerase specialized sigma24 family protein